MARQFVLPDLGEGISEAQVVRLLVAQGDSIAEDQALMEVETDKAAVEIPSPFGGVIAKVHVEEGQTVNVGDVMVTFGNGGVAEPVAARASASAAAPAAKVESQPEAAPAIPRQPPRGAGKSVPAAPAVRKLARQLGVDLGTVRGSGPGGRVLREDVESAVRGEAAKAPPTPGEAPPATRTRLPVVPPGVPDADRWGPIRRAPLTQIRKTIATRMSQSASTIPHVTHFDDADITELDRLRRGFWDPERPDLKLTLMPFVIKAVAESLKRFPELNASFDDQAGEIVYKEYVSIGLAVDTERGLIVPVIRNVERLDVRQIAEAGLVLAQKVRKTQFAIEELRGGTFTITNVGALGGRYSTPIINYPEVAILGTGRSRSEPVVVDGRIEPRVILPLSLSFDHRATDGAAAARFTSEVIGYLENPARLLL
jgi:pyruvate dehydrogenase complex dihydrolipoamide acetyltransferase long form